MCDSPAGTNQGLRGRGEAALAQGCSREGEKGQGGMGKPQDDSMPFARSPGRGIRVAVGLPAFGIQSFPGSRRPAPGEVSDVHPCPSTAPAAPQPVPSKPDEGKFLL